MKNSSNIAADLDLTQSLQRFESLVKAVLSVEDLEGWDGHKFQEKEQEIRQGALILAGQCIALVISKLATSSQARDISKERTRGLRTAPSKGHGLRSIQVTTLGNVTVPLKIPYVVQGSGKGMRGARSGQWIEGGFYPFLHWLGMAEGVTPLVWATIAEYGMVSVSFATAQRLLQNWGVTLSERRVARLTYRFGQVGLDLRAQQVAQLQAGILPRCSTLADQRVVISVDGGRTRLRRNKRGKRRQKSGRHGFHGDWREPLLLTIYGVDDEGKKINNRQFPITNDGTFGHHQALLQLLEMHLVRLGIQACRSVLLLADGARWMWNQIPALLERLGVASVKIFQLFDFYHAVEHLQDFAQLAFSAKHAIQKWVRKSRSLLKRGGIKSLIEKMQDLIKPTTGDHQKALTKTLDYFSRQPERFLYHQVAAMKLPIGSGSIESLVRQVVNLRLKGNGKFWLPQRAEIILHGRCQWAAGNWSTFSRAILTAGLS